MWQCLKCKRSFTKNNQSHSCVVYPIENHFKDKNKGKKLFYILIGKIEKNTDKVKIESLPCCIHLLSNYTFSGVWILKDGITVDFALDKKIESKRFIKEQHISKNRYIYYLEIQKEEDIDTQLLEWIKQAYFLKTVNHV